MTTYETLVSKMIEGTFTELKLENGYSLFTNKNNLLVKNSMGQWPVTLVVVEEPIELVKDGYENGVNCINRVGRDDELIAGWFSDDGHIIRDESETARDEGVKSRHGGNTGAYRYNRQEQISLSRMEWALCLEGHVGNGGDSQEFTLYVGK